MANARRWRLLASLLAGALWAGPLCAAKQKRQPRAFSSGLRLFFVAVVSASLLMLASCCHHEACYRSEQNPPPNPQPRAQLLLRRAGQKGRFVVELKNTGDGTITVDRELVFLLQVTVLGPDGQRTNLEEGTSLPSPNAESLERRLTGIRPRESVRRTIDLQQGFKAFEGGSSFGPGYPALTAYEAILRVPKGSEMARVAVKYGGPDSITRDALAYYFGGVRYEGLGLFDEALHASLQLADAARDGGVTAKE